MPLTRANAANLQSIMAEIDRRVQNDEFPNIGLPAGASFTILANLALNPGEPDGNWLDNFFNRRNPNAQVIDVVLTGNAQPWNVDLIGTTPTGQQLTRTVGSVVRD
jgi:hypothetical protein